MSNHHTVQSRLSAVSAAFLRWLSRDWWVILLYVAAASLMTYPLVTRLGGDWLPYDSDDLWLKLWDIWYTGKVLSHDGSIFYTRFLFYPNGADLSLHSINWVSTFLSAPVAGLFGVATAYKVSILAGAALSAYSAYLLIRLWVDHPAAAWLGGAVYALGPYYIRHAYSHPDHTRLWAIPLLILLLIIAVSRGKLAAAAGAGVFYGLVGWSSLYSFGFASITLAIVLPFYLVQDRRWREKDTWWALATFALVSAILLGARLAPVFAADLGYAVGQKYNPATQTDLLAYLIPTANPFLHPLVRILTPRLADSIRWSPYIGLVPLALIIYAFVRPRQQAERWLWLIVTLTFLVLSAGVTLRFNSRNTAIPLPAGLLHNFTLFRAVDAEYYHEGLLLGLAVLAGFGLDSLLAALPQRRLSTIGVPLLLSAFLLFEYGSGCAPMQFLPPDPYYGQLANEEGTFAVIHIPMTYLEEKRNLYRQTQHERPMAGGFLGREPAGADSYIQANALLSALSRSVPLDCDAVNSVALEQGIRGLLDDGFRYVLIHDAGEGWPLAYFDTVPTTYTSREMVVVDLRLLINDPPCAFAMAPAPEAEAVPLLQIPAPDGDLPCGVFDVRGQGQKQITLADFPACADAASDATFAVMCLDGEGQWSAANVLNLVQDGARRLTFESAQHGHCAIFAVP